LVGIELEILDDKITEFHNDIKGYSTINNAFLVLK